MRTRCQPHVWPILLIVPLNDFLELGLLKSGDVRAGPKTSAADLFSAPLASPSPNPVLEPNRCNLEPFKPETPKTTLYLVLPKGRLTLQVVCLGLAHFQLPVLPPKAPSPPTGENPGRPWGGWAGAPP